MKLVVRYKCEANGWRRGEGQEPRYGEEVVFAEGVVLASDVWRVVHDRLSRAYPNRPEQGVYEVSYDLVEIVEANAREGVLEDDVRRD